MSEGQARISCRSKVVRSLANGQSLTFGRSVDCDVVLGAGSDGLAEDTGISRHAGRLQFDGGLVTIANDSRSRVLVMCPKVGPERTVGIGQALTVSDEVFSVLLKGQVYLHRIEVEVERVGAAPDPVVSRIANEPPTRTIGLTDRERRYCAALCEPLLAHHSLRISPATYRQAADRLGLQPTTIRKHIDEVRHRLTIEGFHGLDGETGRDELVRLLVESGTITVQDLALLGSS